MLKEFKNYGAAVVVYRLIIFKFYWHLSCVKESGFVLGTIDIWLVTTPENCLGIFLSYDLMQKYNFYIKKLQELVSKEFEKQISKTY